MIGARSLVVALLISFVSGPLLAADARKPANSATATPTLAPEGKLKHPQSLNLVSLRRLPAEQVQVSFQSDRGTTTASYTGVRLWALLMAAGGIADDEKAAELRHIAKITGRDGYVVVISTGEIAPDFGGQTGAHRLPARQRASRRGRAAPHHAGRQAGGRNVRDVIAIRVE